jgi:hypothetical protein
VIIGEQSLDGRVLPASAMEGKLRAALQHFPNGFIYVSTVQRRMASSFLSVIVGCSQVFVAVANILNRRLVDVVGIQVDDLGIAHYRVQPVMIAEEELRRRIKIFPIVATFDVVEKLQGMEGRSSLTGLDSDDLVAYGDVPLPFTEQVESTARSRTPSASGSSRRCRFGSRWVGLRGRGFSWWRSTCTRAPARCT